MPGEKGELCKGREDTYSTEWSVCERGIKVELHIGEKGERDRNVKNETEEE